MVNFFELLGLSPAFDIDLQALESAYFKAQRACHPDRFVGKSAADRQAALLRSGDVNTAYQTLKNPLPRAQYLLHLQGIAVGTEADSIKPTPALLMETMEWREKIAAADDADTINTLDNTLAAMIAASEQSLSKHFSAGRFADMVQEALRLGYLLKAREAVTLQQKRREKQAL